MAVPWTITLTDSGKRKANVSDPQTSYTGTGTETDKAKAGSAVTLYVKTLRLTAGSSLDTATSRTYRADTNTNEYMNPEVNKGAVNSRKWSVSGTLDLTVSADRTTFGNLCRMVTTKGYKELATTADNDNPCMIRWSYETAVANVVVRIENFTASQKIASKMSGRVNYSFDMIETS